MTASASTASGAPSSAVPTSTAGASSPTSPLPTTPPLTELEALLPSFAGDSFLERRVITAADFAGSGSGYVGSRVFERLFANTGHAASDFEGAAASGSISIIAMRLHGIAAPALATAFIDASLAEVPGGVVTSGRIGGRDVRQLRWPNDPMLADVTVMVTGDVVLVAGAYPKYRALVDDALTTMFEPKLEALLPATLDGRPVVRSSFPGASVGTGGDICSFVCPGEPQALAAKLGVDIADVDIAAGILQTPPGVVIVAMRFPGAPTDHLIAARIAAVTRPDLAPRTRALKIAGKAVTYALYGPFPIFGQEEYLYAHDHVLYTIRVEPGQAAVPAIVTAAIKALP